MNTSRKGLHSDAFFLERSAWHTPDNLTLSTEETVSPKAGNTVKFYNDITDTLWYVVPPVLLVFGTFGNVMTMVVMQGMRRAKSTSCLCFYFTVLAVSDQCHLISCLLWFWVYKVFSWPPSFFRFDLLCKLPKFVWTVASVISVWCLVAMTYQRVTSVVAPHRVGVLCTVRRGKIIVVIIALLGFALHSQFLFTWVYWPEYGVCQYRPEYMYLGEIFEWLALFFNSIIPFLCLFSGNSVLVWHVMKSMKLSHKMRASVDQRATLDTEKMSSMTFTLILTSAVLLVFSLPVCLYDVILQTTYLDITDPALTAKLNLVFSVFLILCFSTFATNFYLYLLSGRKFRQETKRYLFCFDTDHVK